MAITVQHTINGVDPQVQLRAGTLHVAEYEPLLPVTQQDDPAGQPWRIVLLHSCLAIRGPPLAGRNSRPDNQDRDGHCDRLEGA